MSELLSIADDFLARARRAGADAADVLAAHSTDLTCSIRKGIPDTLERSESKGLGLRVFIGQSFATVSTSDLSADNLDTLAETAVAIARAAPPDPFTGLADPTRLARELPDLDLFDPNEPTLEALQQQCREAEEAGTNHTGITNSDGADAGYSAHAIALVTSGGYRGTYRTSHTGLSLTLIAGTGGDMQRDYSYSSTRHAADLRTPRSIGDEAARRTLARMHPEKLASCKVPLLFDPRIARSFLASLASAVNGASVARGTSFLKDAMGTQLFDSTVTILDDPRIHRALASRPADGEGVATAPLTLIESGILKSWFLDTRTANQLGLTTTGHASRSMGSGPSPSCSNLYLKPGTATPSELMADIKDGIYITDTFGMGVNLTTGDYSQGASGLRIINGEITTAVSEITIAGHLLDMFKHLIPANDLTFETSINSPTLRIDGMTVAGA